MSDAEGIPHNPADALGRPTGDESADAESPEAGQLGAPGAVELKSADAGSSRSKAWHGNAASWQAFRRVAASRKTAWALVAVICVVAGVVGSVLGARAVSRGEAAKRQLVFHAAAAEVASRLRLAISQQEDLAASASTFFAVNPHASKAELQAWAREAQVLRSFPGLERLSLVAFVPRQELVPFEARLGVAPRSLGPLAASRAPAALGIVPARQRPFYCLAVAGIARDASNYPPKGVDYCASSHALLGVRDSGSSSYTSVSNGATAALGVTTPVYRGSAPASVAARRQAFVGWLRELLLPGVVLREALKGYPQGAVRVRRAAGSSSVVFASAAAHAGMQSTTMSLPGGWSVRIFGPPTSAGVFASGPALAVLIGGCLLSVLFGLFVFALGGARLRLGARTDHERAHETLYDALTGLPNSALMADLARRLVMRTGRQSGLLCGALLINIDWFKDINAKLGQPAGDQLLLAVAQRLEGVVRANDTVGRLREDEFLVLVEAAARSAKLDSLARRMIEALHKPVELDDFGPQFHMTASIGVAFGQYESHEDLIRDARSALVAAKAAGKDRYTVFNANMRSVVEGRGLLEAELNKALLEKQFFPLYQPIWDLRSQRILGLDAVIRWRHPSRGVLAPSDFIELAEETGLIVPIGRWLLEEVCSSGAAWRVAGHSAGMFVRVSDMQLKRDGFATDVRRALQQSGLDPASLILQIDETAVMFDTAAATERLQALKSTGVRVAIDDFGSAYAYRPDLQQLPIDFLKVDRSTLAASDTEEYRRWLLEAILVFGRDLSLPVIAKGVETSQQLQELQAYGCTVAQGFFLGEPVPAEAVEGLFESARLPEHPAAAGPGIAQSSGQSGLSN
jgi:diguanylate cyclase (GGDEF)-like protein